MTRSLSELIRVEIDSADDSANDSDYARDAGACTTVPEVITFGMTFGL
jgi:hypothetical protein